jgi:prephenate dehydratase
MIKIDSLKNIYLLIFKRKMYKTPLVVGDGPPILKDSERKKEISVAYLGPRGTFSEQAARKFFTQKNVKFVEALTIREIFEKIVNRKIDYGVVPLENSIEGSVNITLDLLYHSNIKICGEIEEPINHNLIVKPGTKRETIKIIVSHPQALAQCLTYIERNFPKAVLKEASSTAAAVKNLRKLKNAAAIGTMLAAKIYGMKILDRNIDGENKNFTRFIVLSLKDGKPTGKDKTSIIFSVKDEPGALYKALKPFATRNINLTKIESRPAKDEPWSYIFFTDFEGHRKDEKCRDALKELSKQCKLVKVLGSYPKAV